MKNKWRIVEVDRLLDYLWASCGLSQTFECAWSVNGLHIGQVRSQFVVVVGKAWFSCLF